MYKEIPHRKTPGKSSTSRAALLACALTLLSAEVTVGQPNPTLVSVNSAGTGSGNFRSDDWTNYRITPDGRYVVFRSEATNLVVPHGTTRLGNIYVRDLQLGTTRLVSVALDGTSANNGSGNCLISDNGRYVAFTSHANNLVPNDTSFTDVFLRDLQTNTTRMVSVNAAGNSEAFNASELLHMTPDGRFITFWSNGKVLTGHPDGRPDKPDIYVRDMVTNVTKLVTINAAGTASGNGNSYGGTEWGGSTSDDGRYVVFSSEASDLVANDTDTRDVFLRDLLAGTTIRLSTNATGTAGGNDKSGTPVIERNGRFVVFETLATDLTTVLDRNRLHDIVFYELQTGTKRLLTLNSAGTETAFGYEGNLIGLGVKFKISDDGRFVAFSSHLENMVANDINSNHDVFLYEVATQSRTLVSVTPTGSSNGAGGSDTPSVSASGRFVAFTSIVPNLANGQNEGTDFDGDVFVRDVVAGKTYLASVNSSGTTAGNFNSTNPFISADGTRMVFYSRASDLITNDLNGFDEDIFVYTILTNDPPALLTEVDTERAVALDSTTQTSDPFALTNPFFASDGQTRISLFARGLVLIPGEGASALTANAQDEQGRVYDLPVEYVGATPGLLSINQIIVKLPVAVSAPGDFSVRITLRGITSNRGLIRIKATNGSLNQNLMPYYSP